MSWSCNTEPLGRAGSLWRRVLGQRCLTGKMWWMDFKFSTFSQTKVPRQRSTSMNQWIPADLQAARPSSQHGVCSSHLHSFTDSLFPGVSSTSPVLLSTHHQQLVPDLGPDQMLDHLHQNMFNRFADVLFLIEQQGFMTLIMFYTTWVLNIIWTSIILWKPMSLSVSHVT